MLVKTVAAETLGHSNVDKPN